MFNDNYNHSVIKKYYVYFASLFANVYLERDLADGQVAARIQVPLHFAKVEHALERVLEDPTETRPDAITLPVMAFDLLDTRYAASRHTPTRNRQSVSTSNVNAFSVMHTPVPYDFHFRLAILVKNLEDGLKIVEQILPYFSPDYTARLELIPEMSIYQNIPIVLESCSMDFDVPAAYKERVTFVWNLDFSLQGYVYGPVKTWPVIKFANVAIGIYDGNTTQVAVTVTTQPGLTANGQPTTDPAETVDYLTISVSDNYGYVTQTHEVSLGANTS